MVNVTKSNFIEQSNDLISRLPSAAFVAIDEEMTGITIPNSSRPPKDQTPEERYQALKAVPEKYTIIQLGVCLFHEHPDYEPDGSGDAPEFIARKYNFFCFPPADNRITREVVLNASSIAFLSQHNMDFDLWTKQGTSFVTGEMAEDLIAKYQERELERQEKQAAGTSNALRPGRRRLELRRTEDIDFHARAMASLREWLDSAQPGPLHGDDDDDDEGISLLLPPANSYLRRALYESIAVEYPSLILENAGNQIRVLRLNPLEQRARQERLKRESWEDLIINKIGVWRVFMALSLACHGLEIPSDSVTFARKVGDVDWVRGYECLGNLRSTGRQVPMVLHNGYMDLLFLLTHFHSHKLPSKFPEAKSLIHSYFPAVYDTKFCFEQNSSILGNWNCSTALETLFIKFCREDLEMRRLVEIDSGNVGIGMPVGHDLEDNADGEAHDAAFDAYMTGCVFSFFGRHIALYEHFDCDTLASPATYRQVGSLSHLLCDPKDELVRKLFGRNKLCLMQSIYAVDLETKDHDPHCRGMIPEAIFRITDFDPSATTRTIIQCLSDIVDTRGESVNFELYWCNDTTFLVAASSRTSPIRQEDRVEVLQEHGRLILNALQRRFHTAKIVSWADRNSNQKQQEGSWSSRIMNLFNYALGRAPGSTTVEKKRENDSVADPLYPQPKRRRIR